MTTAIAVTKEMIEAVSWSASPQEGMPWGMILDDKAIENILSIGLANSAALTPHGEEAAGPVPESHSKASEIIAAIRHQLEINVQIAEQNSPEGPIVDGKRVKGLTHSQDILAQHIRDHLSELELVIASEAPSTRAISPILHPRAGGKR